MMATLEDLRPIVIKTPEAKGWMALSRETGLSRSVLYAALSGVSEPRIGTVMKILKALGVKVYFDLLYQHQHTLFDEVQQPTAQNSGTNNKEAVCS